MAERVKEIQLTEEEAQRLIDNIIHGAQMDAQSIFVGRNQAVSGKVEAASQVVYFLNTRFQKKYGNCPIKQDPITLPERTED